jgi:soluble lytic murein transglycosylase-like protein
MGANVAAAASMYRYRGPAGEVVFTDRKLDDPRYTLLSHSRNGQYLGKLSTPATSVSRQVINNYILAASKRYSVDTGLIQAIVETESGFQPYAISPAGAVGLMQLMPDTAAGYHIADLMDPEANIDAGVRHVAHLLHMFGGDVHLAVAAYNAGAGSVKHYGGVPPYAETQRYVEKVLHLWRKK